MKAFTITPILFIGLFIITGIVLLNFFDLDTKLSDAINRESRLNNIYYDFMENKTQMESLLLFYSIDELKNDNRKSAIQTSLRNKLGDVTVIDCQVDFFVVEYSYNFNEIREDLKIDKNVLINKKITCDIANEVHPGVPSSNCVDCNN